MLEFWFTFNVTKAAPVHHSKIITFNYKDINFMLNILKDFMTLTVQVCAGFVICAHFNLYLYLIILL